MAGKQLNTFRKEGKMSVPFNSSFKRASISLFLVFPFKFDVLGLTLTLPVVIFSGGLSMMKQEYELPCSKSA